MDNARANATIGGGTPQAEKPLYLYPIPVVIDGMDLFVCLICIIFNGSIILVTAKTKRIRANRCCLLIALLSLAHIGAKTGSIIPKVIAWTVVSVPQFPHCTMLLTLGTISGTTAAFMILMIAIDRLIGAAFPIWYKQCKNAIYFGIIGLVCSLPSVYKVSAIYIYSMQPENAEKLVVCTSANILTRESALFNYIYGLCATGSSVVAYFFVVLTVKWHNRRNPNSAFSKSTRKIYRSLLAIIVLNTFGWLFGFSFVTVTHLLIPGISPMDIVVTERIQALLMDTNSSIDAVILYFTSSLYREAYKRLIFAAIKNFCRKPSAVMHWGGGNNNGAANHPAMANTASSSQPAADLNGLLRRQNTADTANSMPTISRILRY